MLSLLACRRVIPALKTRYLISASPRPKYCATLGEQQQQFNTGHVFGGTGTNACPAPVTGTGTNVCAATGTDGTDAGAGAGSGTRKLPVGFSFSHFLVMPVQQAQAPQSQSAPSQHRKSLFKSTALKVTVEAEKLPLQISVLPAIYDSLPPEKQDLINSTKHTLEKEGFLWGRFPLRLPTSALEDAFAQVKEAEPVEEVSKIDLSTIFKSPDMIDAELLSLSREAGVSKKLTEEHLKSIKEEVQFKVTPSSRKLTAEGSQ